MGEQTDLQPSTKLLRRATANALWKPLRRALQDGWPVVTDWTNHDPRGNPRTSDLTTGGVPGPLPTYTPTNETGRVLGRLEAKDWPGNNHVLTARLWQDAYDRLHEALAPQAQHEWLQAWTTSNAHRPFINATNRHGTATLRRNTEAEARITEATAALLEALAAAAEVQLLTVERDAEIQLALLDDQIEVINATEVFAIAQKSGVKPTE